MSPDRCGWITMKYHVRSLVVWGSLLKLRLFFWGLKTTCQMSQMYGIGMSSQPLGGGGKRGRSSGSFFGYWVWGQSGQYETLLKTNKQSKGGKNVSVWKLGGNFVHKSKKMGKLSVQFAHSLGFSEGVKWKPRKSRFLKGKTCGKCDSRCVLGGGRRS